MVDPDRLSAAHATARCDLLAESSSQGHWAGEFSASPLATAAAVGALALVERHAPTVAGRLANEDRECQLSRRIVAGLHWLADRQNSDGGWGDSDRGPSSAAATMLVRAAFALTAVPADHPGILDRADAYLRTAGRLRAVSRQCRGDKWLMAAMLVPGALAGLYGWRRVPVLAFERVCWFQRRPGWLVPPLVEHTIPLLVAAGQARFVHAKPLNPVVRAARSLALVKSLAYVEALQAADGAFQESALYTGLVVMALSSSGRADHRIVGRGVDFLLRAARPDGSWAIHEGRAVAATALASCALAASGDEPVSQHVVRWLLDCRRRLIDPQRGVEWAAWSWADNVRTLADTHDTALALIALSRADEADAELDRSVLAAAAAGVEWLLAAQNLDGGWPAFGGRQAKAPFNLSGNERTAMALRALATWRGRLKNDSVAPPSDSAALDARIGAGIECGLRYLAATQHTGGAWQSDSIVRFGETTASVSATSQVLLAFNGCHRAETAPARRALAWLAQTRRKDGGWAEDASLAHASVEATALASEALWTCGAARSHEAAAHGGIEWLIDAVEANRHHEAAPLSTTPLGLSYFDRSTPLALAVMALAAAAARVPAPIRDRAVVRAAKA